MVVDELILGRGGCKIYCPVTTGWFDPISGETGLSAAAVSERILDINISYPSHNLTKMYTNHYWFLLHMFR